MREIRSASFALRVVRRKGGAAGIVYRRSLKANGTERLTRVAAIGPLAWSAGAALLRGAANTPDGRRVSRLEPGPFYVLDPDSGARVACYALVARGLRNGAKLHRAAGNLRRADGAEAAWWFGLMTTPAAGPRAIRALRILVEAVR